MVVGILHVLKNQKDVQKKLLTFLHHQDYEDSNMSLVDLENKMKKKKFSMITD